MTEEVCVECGARIPASTDRGMKGLCIPCKMKPARTDPFHVLYKSLIDRVHNSPGGLDILSNLARERGLV
jgi:hypothetical protein